MHSRSFRVKRGITAYRTLKSIFHQKNQAAADVEEVARHRVREMSGLYQDPGRRGGQGSGEPG
ncbi:hypothetical protein Csp1_26080 [Corynebacterium provencense]|uniref:Uncharacterized protein n=1 Tax=Corynebacterium provencense TaxID=1737425 RepID=A0A2Z3YQW1_9CORY|nr:hypothetical protein Csp1_26080 [Corynebacterium provencense]